MKKKSLGILAGALIAAGSAITLSATAQTGGHFGGGPMLGDMLGGMGRGGGFGWGRRAGMWLQRLDANKDGTVTLEEMLAVREPLFARLDANKDGVIDAKEFETQARERFEFWAKRLVRRFDQDRDGKITRDELARYARDRFAMRDLNDDGKITAEDLPPGLRGREGRFWRWTRRDARDEERAGPSSLDRMLRRFDRIFQRYDRNGDGVIDASDVEAVVTERVAYASKRFLHRFDQNRDGKVSADEFNRFAKERFAFFDVNDDGKITEDEWPPALRGAGGPR
jgi:Ca2+-binding EF-hand superfamily protein